MFQANEALQNSGGDAWAWIAGLYGRDAVMAIRRELDGQAGVLNLFHLLHDMETHPHVLTRARHRGSFVELPQFRAQLVDQEFERFGGPPGPGTPEDHIPAAVIANDRAQLQRDTKAALDYAQRLVAHRTPIGEMPLTIREVDEAMRAVFRCLSKYYGFLAGGHSPGRHPYRSLTGSHHSALPGRCPPSTFRETSSIHDVVDENLTRCITSRFGGLELAMLAPAAGESTSSGWNDPRS